jgi:hypothetical protein
MPVPPEQTKVHIAMHYNQMPTAAAAWEDGKLVLTFSRPMDDRYDLIDAGTPGTWKVVDGSLGRKLEFTPNAAGAFAPGTKITVTIETKYVSIDRIEIGENGPHIVIVPDGGDPEPTVDKAKLSYTVATARMVVIEAFTNASHLPFLAALISAESALINNALTQEAVNLANAQLIDAAAQLKLKPGLGMCTELVGLLLSIMSLDGTLYTPQSWANLMAVAADSWTLVKILAA